MIAQTVLPSKWVIVSDGSTDGTDQIVKSLFARLSVDRTAADAGPSGASIRRKGTCLQCRLRLLGGTEYEIIGNLDADITFEPDYFEFLLGKFAADPKLGVAGTPFVEDHDDHSKHTYAHQFAQLEHVSGACQMFRRDCFEVSAVIILLKEELLTGLRLPQLG